MGTLYKCNKGKVSQGILKNRRALIQVLLGLWKYYLLRPISGFKLKLKLKRYLIVEIEATILVLTQTGTNTGNHSLFTFTKGCNMSDIMVYLAMFSTTIDKSLCFWVLIR